MTGGTLTHCVVRDLVYLSSKLYNCSGAGIGVGGNNVTIDTCLIRDNTCFGGWNGNSVTRGGGIYVGDCTGVVVQNCTVVNNSAKEGGGIYTANSSTVVRNCVFAGNTATTQSPSSAGCPNLCAANAGTWAANVGPCVVDSGKGVGDAVRVGDPLFVDAANGDFHLASADSPAVGFGVSYDGQEGDLEGKVRKTIPDCGCYETDYVIVPVAVGASFDRNVCNKGETIAFSATVTGIPEGETVSATWKLTDTYGTEYLLPGTGLTVAVPMTVAGYFTLTCSVVGMLNPGVRGTFIGSQTLRVIPPVVYVDVASTNPRIPYDTPQTAATGITAVFDVVSTNCTIQFAEGTYIFDKNVRDKSKWKYAFELDYPFTLRGAGRDKTTLKYSHTDNQASGEPAFGIVLLNHPQALVEDMTLSRGIASYGGSVKIEANGGTVRRCRISDGNARYQNAQGSALYMNSAEALVTDCLIEDNDSLPLYGWGGVVGTIYVNAGTLRNCIVRNNTVTRGDKNFKDAREIVHAGAQAVVENCTIVGNEDRSDQPAALYVALGAQVINTIITSNAAPNVTTSTTLYGAPDWRVASVAAANGVSNCFFNADIPLGAACRSGEVGFVDYAGTNYMLTLESRCCNRGQTKAWMDGATDFYGQPRVFGSCVDIGAAECQEIRGMMLLVR